MSVGPYRDLGSGFARLTGVEAPRRAPSPITCVEDALYEMLRNARDARARSIFIASRLSARRYRTLTVIDDGEGFPPAFASSIFDPGVTTRYLAPTRHTPGESPHGAGLSLHHIRDAAVEAHAPNNADPTAIQATFDTKILPERTLQSPNTPRRNSSSNLTATARSFATENPEISIYYGTPASTLATIIKNHIIPQKSQDAASGAPGTSRGLVWDRRAVIEEGGRVGLEVSVKTAGRILSGELGVLERLGVGGGSTRARGTAESPGRGFVEGGAVLKVGDKEQEEIAAILRRVAEASYLELQRVEFRSVGGEIRISAHVEEPEDEYG